jgi:hypothetical protein
MSIWCEVKCVKIDGGTPSISDHHQSWGYEDGPSKGPGPRAAGGR